MRKHWTKYLLFLKKKGTGQKSNVYVCKYLSAHWQWLVHNLDSSDQFGYCSYNPSSLFFLGLHSQSLDNHLSVGMCIYIDGDQLFISGV